MSLHLKKSSAWLAVTALGLTLSLAACSSDGKGISLSGGGAGGAGGVDGDGDGDGGGAGTASTGTLSRTVDGTSDLSGGLLSSTGNVGNALDGLAERGDGVLNGLAKVTLSNDSVVGSGDGSSQQLIGANVLSSNPQSGSLLTATINDGTASTNPTSPPGSSSLIGVSAAGTTINPGGGTPTVGVNLLSPTPVQGSTVTGTVNAPQTGGVLSGTGGLLNAPLPTNTPPASGLLGGLLPTQ